MGQDMSTVTNILQPIQLPTPNDSHICCYHRYLINQSNPVPGLQGFGAFTTVEVYVQNNVLAGATRDEIWQALSDATSMGGPNENLTFDLNNKVLATQMYKGPYTEIVEGQRVRDGAWIYIIDQAS